MSPIYDTAAVILDLHCTRYYRENDIADTYAYRKLIIKNFRQHFPSQNRTAQFAQYYKIVLHTFKLLLPTLCSKTRYFRYRSD